uniref:G-protein coupled receptors family 1 profile domain-containing protein n=1 Tax=Knipowitschia caucasica TaxID=637954 RepID=A0AAV2K9G0_KNICA
MQCRIFLNEITPLAPPSYSLYLMYWTLIGGAPPFTDVRASSLVDVFERNSIHSGFCARPRETWTEEKMRLVKRSTMILNASDVGWVETSGEEPFYMVDDLPSTSPSQLTPLTVWGVALCVSGTVIAMENAVVVTTILATPSLRAPVFLLLASLGFADLLAGVALILHFLFLFCVEPSDCLMGVALDRYLSLSHALTYGSGQSRRRAAALLLLVWLGACVIGAVPAMGWHCLEDPNVFVGCWMPFSLWGLLGDASSPPLYTYATLVPAAGSSLLNPLLYSLRNKDIRRVLMQTCCPHRSTHSTHVHYPVDV